MTISPIEALNISPEVADRLRERRPGYEEIAALLVEFDEISRSKKSADLSPEDVAQMFVSPTLEALGWNPSVVEEPPFWNSQNQIFPMIIDYRSLRVVVGVYASSSLNDEHGIVANLMDWASDVGGENALLTNFNEFQFLKFGYKRNSQDQDLLGTETIIETRRKLNIHDYLTNESSEFDILAAEQFYRLSSLGLTQSTSAVTQDRQAQQKNVEDLMALLQLKTPFSSAFQNPATLIEFAKKAQFLTYQQGSFIFEQGEQGKKFFFVIKGQLRASDMSTTPPRLLWNFGRGTLVGTQDIMGRDTVTPTIEVISSEAEVAFFNENDFNWLLDVNSVFKDFFENLDIEHQSSNRDSDESLKTTREIPPPDLIAPYGEPDGPRRRYATVMPGIAFQTEGLPRRTITALVLDRDSQKPYLLLAGGDIPAGTEIIQPALDSGDLIGEVERRLFDSAIGLGALASLEGERSFLSLLPSSRPIAGVTQPAENLAVCKFGGGSGYTTGRITALNSRVTLTDDSRRNILLPNAFTVSGDPPFSERGDVGAPVLAIDSNELVGVVVGYNDSGAICLPIQPILNALNVELVSEPVLFFREQTPSHDLSAANDRIFGRDRLGFSHYVSAFVSLINDKNTKPPLTIGIYGAWGTGKSFLMHKIACALKPQDCPGEIDESPPAALSLVGKTVLVEFEAWDYNGSDKLWAGLVERIFSALERELGWYWQLKFNFWRNLKRQWQQARQKVLPYVLISLALALVVVWLLLEPANRAAIATGGVITFLLLFVPQLIKLFSTSASQRVIDMFAAQDYKADIGFMGRIKADLRDFADNLTNATKVIVFIDDLDRCDPKKAVEVLEAVKLLLELDRFIVFLAIDARIITQAVEEYYGKVLTEAEITGYEYLDKIVQIPFSIPEPRPAELRNYLGSLMGLSEAQVQALEPEIVPPAPEFVGRRVTSPPPAVSVPASGDGPSGEATVSPPAAASPPADEAKQPPPRPTPPAEPTESEARPVTPTPPPFDTIEVPFTPDEQKAFLRLYPHLDPNPRRLKRLVNIYRLVRVLLRSQSNGQVTDFVTTPAGQSHVLAWLVLCEQWPYASHMMLEEIDQQFKAAQTDADARLALEQKTIGSIYPVAQQRIAAENNEALQKLDLKYERLEAFFNQHLAGFSLADLRRLRPFTINFNPALSAEVRLTLAHH